MSPKSAVPRRGARKRRRRARDFPPRRTPALPRAGSPRTPGGITGRPRAPPPASHASLPQDHPPELRSPDIPVRLAGTSPASRRPGSGRVRCPLGRGSCGRYGEGSGDSATQECRSRGRSRHPWLPRHLPVHGRRGSASRRLDFDRGGHSWFNPGWREGVSSARCVCGGAGEAPCVIPFAILPPVPLTTPPRRRGTGGSG